MAKNSFANNVIAIKIEIDDSDAENEVERHTGPFYAKRARHNNIIAPWQSCTKLHSYGNTWTVRYVTDGKQKEIPAFEIAGNVVPSHDDIKKIGTRVIARHREPYLPYEMQQNKRITLIASRNDEFYSGIIAREYSADDKYCVFFDDGVVQMVEREHIRRVVDNTFDHAHLNARLYFKFYTSEVQYELRATNQLKFGVELDGSVKTAQVMKIDHILVLIKFEEVNRFEWIYLGSPRISQIFRLYVKEKKLDSVIGFQTYTACRTADVIMIEPSSSSSSSSTSSDQQGDRYADDATMIEYLSGLNGRSKKQHNCSHDCVRFEDKVNLTKFALFRHPILCGWKRESRSYRTPCGLDLFSYLDIDKYLVKTQSKLRINCFDLSRDVDPLKSYGPVVVKTNDISRGAEKVPITVCHEMTLDDRSFNYITNYKFDYVDVDLKSNLGRDGCGCTDNCRDKQKCKCWHLTIQRSMSRSVKRDDFQKNKNVGYKNMRLENIVSSGIVECGANCNCCAEKCVNRVVQHGLQHELEVFKTSNRGWGVRTKTDLPPGVFVCNYAGDVLDDVEADKRPSTTYQFKVPVLCAKNHSDRDDESDAEPKPKRYKYPNQYDVVQIMVNYFPPIRDYSSPESKPVDSKSGESGFVIDAIDHGNVARFFNHSCDPNLFVQGVHVGDDERFPEIAFFTQSSIMAGEELTFDYRYDLNEGNPTACLCGADNCRNRLT